MAHGLRDPRGGRSAGADASVNWLRRAQGRLWGPVAASWRQPGLIRSPALENSYCEAFFRMGTSPLGTDAQVPDGHVYSCLGYMPTTISKSSQSAHRRERFRDY